ncbi:MAG: phosphoribosylformylglycinamidine synthase subunit PurL [Planctomycetota bacterium]
MSAPAAAPAAASVPSPSGPHAWRVEAFRRRDVDDPEGGHARAALAEVGLAGLGDVRLGRGYLLPPTLSPDAVARAVRELLADPVLDDVRLYAPATVPAPSAAHRVLVARKPGVMDPSALTLERALRRAGILGAEEGGHVATFRAFEVPHGAGFDAAALAAAARRGLGNEVIETITVGSEALSYGVPSARPKHGRVTVTLSTLDDAALLALSESGQLSLDLVEMRAVQAHYQAACREPSIAELETIAQTWSEHCQHKTFRGLIEMDGQVIDNLLKSTIAAATHELAKPWCVSVFHDNAGVVEFEPDVDPERGGWCLAFKVETHNHPSAIDPYGGAGTGIGGVIRDILGVGLGAKPIANTDAFFVGPMDLPDARVPKGSMHPRRILRGVVAGVRDYGNRMGIPTTSGGVWFDEGYVANPLVYAGTVGLMPRDCVEKEIFPGDVILVVGGRTGRDGIHGATFSSVELHEESETEDAASVQIGDAIQEKRVLDGLLRARDLGLYRAVTDCGAGGLSSAIGEMGAAGKTKAGAATKGGALVDLERVPLKYPGLAPEEIWISEAQERMVLAVPPEHLAACIATFAAEDCEATAIGTFTDTGRLVLRYEGEVIGDMDLHFLHEGTPRPTRKATWTAPNLPDPGCPPPGDDPASADWNGALLALLRRPNVASKQWIVRQYDHEVQGMSVVKPFAGVRRDAPSDGVVLKPLASSQKGVALGSAAHPRYGILEPERMALASIDEALRNVVAVGGDPARTSLLDNFSWGNCKKPDRLGALVKASRACYDAAKAYGTPFISGKDSLNNEYRIGEESLAIPPTLYISALSIVPNVANCVTMDVKQKGNLLLLVGGTKAELGGSEYHAHLGLHGGTVPAPDLKKAPAVFAKLHGAMKLKQVLACHDLSEGGLAVALAEMCMAGGLGADVDLAVIDHEAFEAGYDTDATLLFSESCTRFLVEVEPGKKFNFQTKMMGVPCIPIGRVSGGTRIKVKGVDGRSVIDVSVDEAHAAFHGGFQG